MNEQVTKIQQLSVNFHCTLHLGDDCSHFFFVEYQIERDSAIQQLSGAQGAHEMVNSLREQVRALAFDNQAIH